ncbi:MAG: hypothetical protein JXR83_10740 [Deltaproteobacteria bacterium]|nr:hypothetical protein [Deltaproteobacteria bacterium]
MSRLSPLGLLQRHLEGLYRTPRQAPIERFVIDDEARRELARRGAIRARPGAREEVYVLDEGDGLALAVYIDAASRGALERIGEDGTLRLAAASFGDFCIALEAVSHFVLLAHRAAGDRPVTQLELELQAEVDKYLAARLLRWRIDCGPLPEALRRALFQRFVLDRALSSEQRERYRMANRCALRYCDFLERSFIAERRFASLLRELRSFFRAPQSARLHRIGF